MAKQKFSYRNVSLGLQKLREFLLGRKHTLHNRFPNFISSRTIPPPDLPRGPCDNYSNNYYYTRNVRDSVKPPVVAPVAEGPPLNRDPFKKAQPGGIKPNLVCFSCAPTPGPTWWWDGHSYYDTEPETKRPAPDPKAPSPCTVSPPSK